MASKDVITELFLSSYKDLRRYIKHFVHSDETANDIAQEAFLKTFRNAEKLETPRAFLFTVARHLAIDSCDRDKLVKFEQRKDFDEVMATDELPEDLMIRLERSEVLRKAIEHLPPRCREVFSQRVFFGLSYRQIAKRYHLSEKTVEHHIALGLRETTRMLRKARL